MTRDAALIEPELFLQLVGDDGEPVPTWEPDPPGAATRCSPELVRRLTEVARPVGDVRRRFVAGRPVVHHPSGRAIAVADGTAWMAVRSRLPVGALSGAPHHEPDLAEHGWVELDPWAPDTAFARAIDLLRAHVVDAYERAASESSESEHRS